MLAFQNNEFGWYLLFKRVFTVKGTMTLLGKACCVKFNGKDDRYENDLSNRTVEEHLFQ